MWYVEYVKAQMWKYLNWKGQLDFRLLKHYPFAKFKKKIWKHNVRNTNLAEVSLSHWTEKSCFLYFFVVLHVIFSGAGYKFPGVWNAVAHDMRSEGSPGRAGEKKRKRKSRTIVLSIRWNLIILGKWLEKCNFVDLTPPPLISLRSSWMFSIENKSFPWHAQKWLKKTHIYIWVWLLRR